MENPRPWALTLPCPWRPGSAEGSQVPALTIMAAHPQVSLESQGSQLEGTGRGHGSTPRPTPVPGGVPRRGSSAEASERAPGDGQSPRTAACLPGPPSCTPAHEGSSAGVSQTSAANPSHAAVTVTNAEAACWTWYEDRPVSLHMNKPRLKTCGATFQRSGAGRRAITSQAPSDPVLRSSCSPSLQLTRGLTQSKRAELRGLL